jgi:hypothetical protein
MTFKRPAATFVCVSAIVGSIFGGVASADPRPQGECDNDSKLLGRFELSTVDAAGTWWRLTKNGFVAAGYVTEAQQKAVIESFFGTTYLTFDAAKTALVEAAQPFDANTNNYVCASSIRGTVAWLAAVLNDPKWKLYVFQVDDDKHVED